MTFILYIYFASFHTYILSGFDKPALVKIYCIIIVYFSSCSQLEMNMFKQGKHKHILLMCSENLVFYKD